jgi:hypothetical protein
MAQSEKDTDSEAVRVSLQHRTIFTSNVSILADSPGGVSMCTYWNCSDAES